MDVERKDWVRALTAHPVSRLNATADQLAAVCTVRLTRLPQAGLGLLSLIDGALHESYYLGEFPLSTCSVELAFPDGRQAEGGAQVMADDAELARSLAIFDAILAARLPGWEQVAELVTSGALQRGAENGRRRAMLAATRVDFALLSDADEDTDEY
ncbi:MAG: phosphonate C-P lyase system protein PhnG [Gammaproteobacteria bacterium]|nr:phosphonate C-P lyase system protein PhnG [Gammaproteobacteria bacterium]